MYQFKHQDQGTLQDMEEYGVTSNKHAPNLGDKSILFHWKIPCLGTFLIRVDRKYTPQIYDDNDLH